MWIPAALVLLLALDFVRDQPAKPIVFDEALTALLASSPTWEDFGRSLTSGAHHTPPAYFVALRGWIAAASDSTTALRLPSVALTALGTLLLAGALRPVFGLWPALLASVAFTSSSTMLLANANEARPYAAWWAAQAGWLLLVSRSCTRRTAGPAMLGGVAALAFLAPAVQYAAFPFLVASCAGLLAQGVVARDGISVRLALASAVGAVVFTAAHLDLALTQKARNVYGAWIAEPSLLNARVLYADGLAVPWEGVALAGLGAVVGMAWRAPRTRPPTASPAPLVWVAVAWLAVPLGLALVREAGGPNLFYARYCLPLQAVGAGLTAALAARALRNLASIRTARTAAWACVAASLLRLALNDTAPAYSQRADDAAVFTQPGRRTYTTDPFFATVLAWHVRQPGQVVLLAATPERAAQWGALTPLLEAHPWHTFRPAVEPASLLVTQIQPSGFDPNTWVRVPGLRVARPDGPTPGADVWFLDPVAPR